MCPILGSKEPEEIEKTNLYIDSSKVVYLEADEELQYILPPNQSISGDGIVKGEGNLIGFEL